MIAIKNVLVATDFSAGAETALAYGREFARTFGAKLHVLHVVEDVSMQFIIASGTFGGMTPVEMQRDIEAAAAAQLDAVLRSDDRKELAAVTALRTSPRAAQGIVDYAASAEIDLIVAGTHGHSGVVHALLGSVAERLVRTAPCPVLTVRESQREFLKPDAIQRVAPRRGA